MFVPPRATASWASEENKLLAKLAQAYMDVEDFEAAAPLMGALTGAEENVYSLKTQARFTYLRGDSAKAADLMARAKTLAAATWTDDDETVLQRYINGPKS